MPDTKPQMEYQSTFTKFMEEHEARMHEKAMEIQRESQKIQARMAVWTGVLVVVMFLMTLGVIGQVVVGLLQLGSGAR